MLRTVKIFGITLYPYSILMIIGGVVCFLLFMLLSFKRHKQNADENLFAFEMLVLSIFAALPAAMLADSLFKLSETGKFKFGGATFYGGLLTALIIFPALLALKRNKKVSIHERLCDLAPCIPAGHFFGRIGCFLGGCCFGRPTDGVTGVIFAEGSIPYEYYGGPVAIHPTQLYEAAYLALLFAVLLCIKKHPFELYLILYGTGRFFIEFFRGDNRGGFGLPLSPAQLISIILIVSGTALIFITEIKEQKEHN